MASMSPPTPSAATPNRDRNQAGGDPRAPTSPLRLLFLNNSLEGGGAERIFATLLHRLQHRFENVEICAALLDDRPERYSLPADLKVARLGGNTGMRDSARRYFRFVRGYRPHLVFSKLTRANLLSLAAAPLLGYRTIICEHSDTGGRMGAGVGGWLKRLAVRSRYPSARRVITVSEGIRLGLIEDYRLRPEQVETIYNPYVFDDIARRGAEPNPLGRSGYLLGVGRLVPTKRFDVLVRAYAAGNFERPLLILGEGPMKTELEALARQLGVADRITFAGFLDNPYPVMRDAAAYVMCSDLEGFPNAMIETMALGCPNVATNCRHGPAEILDETVLPKLDRHRVARYGILTPPGNPEEMAAAIHRLLDDPALQQQLSTVSRERAHQFSVERSVEQYARVIGSEIAALR